MAWMVIRVRGGIHAKHDIVQTLNELHLTRANHGTVLPEGPSYRGMLSKVQGYVTWGEAEPETLQMLLEQRGKSTEGGSLVAATGDKAGSADHLAELTKSILTGGMARSPGIRPLFRLKPPRGGWRSTKRPYTLGGALGYRGRAINDLAKKMV